MTTHPHQLSLLEYGRNARDLGMARAEKAQDGIIIGTAWSELAYAAIVAVASKQAEVHANDLLGFTPTPAHPNAWGACWQRAIRNKIIAHSGRVKQCVDPAKHAHQSPVYLSLIYGKE